ncbi:hypothetical protein [Francisella salina]|uniref:Chitinase n=1 Tax=Francisella salina TaxID=573569 RepID=A0ABM5M7C5_FRAST|nr:hypothetical protein [Francisella salina]AEI35047.1 hypothetical protein F7308_0119 [Francisella salina]
MISKKLLLSASLLTTSVFSTGSLFALDQGTSKTAFITTSCPAHDLQCLEKAKDYNISSTNYGMLFLNGNNKDDNKVVCKFENLDDNLAEEMIGGELNPAMNPISRDIYVDGEHETTANILKKYQNTGNSVGLVFGGDTGSTRVVDPFDPGICQNPGDFGYLVLDTVKYLTDRGVKVDRVAFDIESSAFREGRYTVEDYEKIKDAISRLKKQDKNIVISIILPQYAEGGYWAKGFNAELVDFIQSNESMIDNITFMLGQGMTCFNKDSNCIVNQMNINALRFPSFPVNKVTALYNHKRTIQEKFLDSNGNVIPEGSIRLITEANKLYSNHFAGVQFWGMTNASTAAIDSNFLELYRVVNNETNYAN